MLKTSLTTGQRRLWLASAIALAALVLPLKAIAETTIIGFGDSLMAGYQLPENEGFVGQLQARLIEEGYADVTVVNAGVSGDTSSGGRDRLDWSVPDGTDLVLLELGANDALRGISPGITRENILAMIDALKARGTDVILLGMLAPINMGADYGAAFNAIYPEAAESRDVPLYPFFMEGVITKPDLLLDDGIHPNADGVAVMVDGVAPLVIEWLESRAD